MGRALGAALLWTATLSPAWAADPVTEALSVGDCSGALGARGEQPVTGATALALAHCQLKLGQPAEALSTLSQMKSARLLAYRKALEGQARLEAGQPDAAITALSTALSKPALQEPLRSQVRFSLAMAKVKRGDLEGARAALNALLTQRLSAAGRLPSPGGLDPAEVRWQLAETAVRRGASARAVPVWRTIWTRNPTSERSAAAESRLKAAGADPHRSPALILERVQTLEKLFRYSEALTLRERLPAGHAARGPRTIARASFKARDYARSAQLHAALPSRNADENLRLALARLRSGDYAGTMTQYRAMAAPGQGTAEMATWKLGYTAYDRGLMDEATAQLGAYLKRYPSGRYAQRARWFRAMAALRAGDAPTAKTRLAEVAKRHPKQAIGATYWLGSLAAGAGDTEAAQQYFQTVLRRWPSSGYAWFAADRLGRTWARRARVDPPPPPAALQGDAWAIGTALSQAGLQAWARPHLESLSARAKGAGKQGALALAHALIEAGSYTKAKALARPHCGPAHRGGDPVAQQACYPRPSGTRIAALAGAAGLPESLPFAIMTAESALRPEVTSPAGARGLMQLMPKLAASLHPQVWPSRPYAEDDLYQPAYNATLGTTELGQLQQTFGTAGITPSLPLIIAGYNGGADAVTRWIAAWPEPPPADLFAENISYTETRKYVQRVLGFLQTYRYVYGD
jgi:soluble lytic murein transglycosylase